MKRMVLFMISFLLAFGAVFIALAYGSTAAVIEATSSDYLSLSIGGRAVGPIRAMVTTARGAVAVTDGTDGAMRIWLLREQGGKWRLAGKAAGALLPGAYGSCLEIGAGGYYDSSQGQWAWVYGRISDPRVARVELAISEGGTRAAPVQGNMFLVAEEGVPPLNWDTVRAYGADGTRICDWR